MNIISQSSLRLYIKSETLVNIFFMKKHIWKHLRNGYAITTHVLRGATHLLRAGYASYILTVSLQLNNALINYQQQMTQNTDKLNIVIASV